MLKEMVQKTKRRKLFILFFLTSMLLGCQTARETVYPSESTPSPEKAAVKEELQISETSVEGCLLCGENKYTLLPLYWGEENIGILSLNTFDLIHLEINRYDDYGNLIEEPSQGTSMIRVNTGDDSFTFMAIVDTDRGYARCDLYFNSDECLDTEKVATHVCSDCMNRVIDDGFDSAPTGIAVINFSTGELKLLRKNLLSFQIGDFFVSCKTKCNKTDMNLEMDLFVFYCPTRYRN